MLPAFFVAEVEVLDAEGFKMYGSRVAEITARYGGRYLVRGGNIDAMEGEAPKRVVISAWKGMEEAHRWYTSPEYSQIIGIRHRTCKTRAFLVEGLSP